MFHVFDDILDGPEVDALREAAGSLTFEDGARTAGTLARAVKSNAQAAPSPARDAVLRKVQTALLSHPGFVSATRPKAFARMLVSTYAGGQAYGAHIDDAIMDGARTDISFTLALSAADSYAGGALIVQDRIEERAFRLEAGQILVYPSDTLHRVEPVTDGTRLAVVGWITSWIRDPAKREILTDLDAIIAQELARDQDGGHLQRLAKTRSNLLRMWAG